MVRYFVVNAKSTMEKGYGVHSEGLVLILFYEGFVAKVLLCNTSKL